MSRIAVTGAVATDHLMTFPGRIARSELQAPPVAYGAHREPHVGIDPASSSAPGRPWTLGPSR